MYMIIIFVNNWDVQAWKNFKDSIELFDSIEDAKGTIKGWCLEDKCRIISTENVCI